MKMKRLAALGVAVVMSLAMGLTAFAAPSPTVSGVVTSYASAKDADGNAVTIKIENVSSEYSAAVAELNSTETLKALLGDQYVDGMSVIDVKDVTADTDNFPVTITFKVAGVTASSKVAVLHYDTTKGAWEVVKSEAGNGTITATFNSLSPVAFVVDKSAAATTTSPKTGESTMPIAMMAVVVLAIGGVYALSRKSRA